MWDVAWTDPRRELVGEHRGRKDRDRSVKEKSLSRNSVSTTSSKTSTHSTLSRLRTRALLRQSSSSKESMGQNTYPDSEPQTPNHSNNRSPSVMSDAEQRPAAGGRPLLRSSDPQMMEAASHEGYYSAARRRFAVVKNTTENKGRAPEISATIAPCARQSDDGDVFSTKGKRKDETPSTVHKNGNSKQSIGPAIRPQRPLDLQSPIRRSFVASPSPSRVSASSPVAKLVPPLRSQIRPPPEPAHEISPINDLSLWRSPREWNAIAEMGNAMQVIETVTGLRARELEHMSFEPSPDSRDLTAEVKQMAQARPSTALARLKASDEDALSLEETQQVNGERKRWMLSVLHHLDRGSGHDSDDSSMLSNGPEMPPGQAGGRKILAAYEPRFSARYLAALWPDDTVHHLSDNPLSSDSAANICAIYSPDTCLPVPGPQGSFDAAYSTTLPSLCGESDIAAVLGNVNKCLRSGGVYHLLLIDPIPNTDALGKKMRAWFRNNLLPKLQRHSRCLTPSYAFSKVLGASCLRGAGSTLTTTKFYANPGSICRRQGEAEAEERQEQEGKETRAELRSIVGRMLWRQVWGEFVTSDTWWWEDPDCMQECLELGTFWEYHSIQAVKSN
ncbi:uncharacterized protein MAM_01718 [Metarhizium album ARSEF 1941]|uniref:Uncharacterized protein n=1 Tax=Metarhizium album (strain ARSEF 1941) TaxID=1081103 RepID=A0A0B2X642_METAS|nr:uncharacterized protein MAM_01718 [Metarhizium album ARSEF 1941]KHO00940.1 hypothetical protein MAM_01718 [Metarhizium album ARSEF 1941]